jgi:hypothetical protein
VAAGTDPLGNPSTDGSLYRVDTTGGTPTLIAGGLANPFKILGRYNGVTYIETEDNTGAAIVSVSDTGAVTNLGQCGYSVAMWGNWIAYVDTSVSKLMGIDLTGNHTPVVVAQVSDPSTQLVAAAVLSDQLLYSTSNPYQICSIQLANLDQGSTCSAGVGDYLVAAPTSDEYFLGFVGSGNPVSSYAPPHTYLLTLFNPVSSGMIDMVENLVYANSWLYLSLAESNYSSRLVRVPTTVGRLPQAILPDSMATRHNGMGVSNINQSMVFAVGATAFFWVQVIDPSNTNQAQYIFSAPLPPQPCDADLPCADSTQVCSNGFCG